MSKHRKVVFLSKHWPADHPMLLRWKHYYESRGVKFISLHVQWNLYYADRKRKIRQVLSLFLFMIRHRAFLLHTNDLESAKVALKMKQITGIPFVYDAHEVFSHEYPLEIDGQFYKDYKKKAEQLIMPAADIVIVPNNERIVFFKQLYPKLKQVNYVLLENKSWTSTNAPANEKFTKQLGTKKSLFYGGTFWMGRKQENFPLLAAALKKVDLQFVLSGSMNDYLKQLLQNDEVVYIGNIPVEEYNDFIRNIDVALAWYYPTTINDELCAPLKIFDYLYAGKPVLAARLPYIQELSVRFPGAIIMFEAGNWEECFMKTKEIIRDYVQYKAAVESIPKIQFTWEGQYDYIDHQLKRAGIQLCVA